VVVVAFKADKLRVKQRRVDVSVAEQLHHVEDVFGFVVFHGGFPVAEGVERDLCEPWILEFGRHSFAISQVDSAIVSWVLRSKEDVALLR